MLASYMWCMKLVLEVLEVLELVMYTYIIITFLRNFCAWQMFLLGLLEMPLLLISFMLIESLVISVYIGLETRVSTVNIFTLLPIVTYIMKPLYLWNVKMLRICSAPMIIDLRMLILGICYMRSRRRAPAIADAIPLVRVFSIKPV